MKTKFYLIILILACFYSCKPQFDEMFDEVIIYNYGYSQVGLTYNVPVKFFFNNKEIATFHLYSFSPDLESGVYNYYDKFVVVEQPFVEFKGVNKTFFKGDCKWGDNIITDGSVTVEKQGDNYTFIVDVTDNKGERHYGKFSGNVKKENWHTKSTLGLFSSLILKDASDVVQIEGYKITTMYVDAGYSNRDGWAALSVGVYVIRPENKNVFEGVYHIGEGILQGWCSYKGYPVDDGSPYGVQLMGLETGTITITKVNQHWRYRIDVDVVARNGYNIKGSFTGNYIHFSFGYDPES